ncbi:MULTISPECIES: DUF4142 domain-containing protein [Pseudomonas]|uniref:DUF4142 domain-containing protein n=2 Tax=Pseudomonas syringae group TaxID=136849 RepID=A0A0D0MPE8_PSEVI|nr:MULTISPECIES: DUF4142 domain-containing protein [Pseudomonas]KTC17823.1 hypothetical protein AO390_05150 [Pseudomonas marginalis ICMP 11289]MBD8569921.1 DUF4142 domain-containing protein [Pseudomonas syringae]VVN21272.1 hypothetical protein PS634_04328 [Pseudomonas fluorescens]EKN46649.1 hypothetical protein AAI_10146 [Pseudomonas viridiflava UASWS0038]KIQ32854.1 membrane protein [Pseudomonas viridiflava]
MTNYFRMSALAVMLSLGSQVALAADDSADFVDNAAAKGIAEVEAGKMAQQKSASADVKTFAEHMIKEHTEANEQLKKIAQTKKLEVADDAMLMDKAKAMILDLRDESFDRSYANNQVMAHEQTIKLFKEQAAEGTDPDVKAFAEKTLPTLEKHLTEAKKLAAAHGGDAAKQ